MRKPLLKLTLALALTAAALLATAKPAQALFCSRWLGCSFTGVVDEGGAICCTYLCNGQPEIGLCQQTE